MCVTCLVYMVKFSWLLRSFIIQVKYPRAASLELGWPCKVHLSTHLSGDVVVSREMNPVDKFTWEDSLNGSN